VKEDQIEREAARFEQARERARADLRNLKTRMRRVLGEAYAGILEAQLLILDDPSLVNATLERIRSARITARWALKEVVDSFVRTFETLDDGYLRERGGDLADVHRRLQRLLRGESPSGSEERTEGPVIVVAHALGPADALIFTRERVAGFVTDVGGRTSHTAILAQALSLPAVVGLHDFSVRVANGDLVAVDGDAGEVAWLPDAGEVATYLSRREAWLARETAMAAGRDLPASTRDGVEVTLRANIELPQEVANAVRFGARGIGLYRSEFLFLARTPEFPSEEDHYRTYRELAEKVAPHPAVIRTLDFGGEKYFHAVLGSADTDPVLGLRAVRFCLQRPDIFRPQVRALLRAAAHAEVRIMIPLVTAAAEVREVRRILAAEAESLKLEGLPCRGDTPLGIMIETPAASATADSLAREVDFMSVGTNDLIQYALAVNRGDETVAYLYQPLHPAILRMIRFVVLSGRSRNIPVALCGEMAADPTLAGLLVGLGLREMSVQPRAIAPVREAIRRVDASRWRGVADEAVDCASALEVADRVEIERTREKDAASSANDNAANPVSL
jgi:phosphotransferase system enzyme I (PtsI)